jgi:hypothetical protein
LKPKNAPTNVNGIEMNSQSASNASNVPNGTAADDPFVQRSMFVRKNMPKTMLEIKDDINQMQ